MSAPKWILKYRSLIMELLNAHILVGLVLIPHVFFGGEGRLSNLLKEKKLYLLYHQWS